MKIVDGMVLMEQFNVYATSTNLTPSNLTLRSLHPPLYSLLYSTI